MATGKYQNKYRIASARMKNYDYASNGAYFITIVTKNRDHFFGDIEDNTMILNEIGKIARKYWDEIPRHFPFIRLDEMVVMPNHIHGILWIDDDLVGGGVSTKVVVETVLIGSLRVPRHVPRPRPQYYPAHIKKIPRKIDHHNIFY
jgi:hypothetical protein